jgi:hypothetical protein
VKHHGDCANDIILQKKTIFDALNKYLLIGLKEIGQVPIGAAMVFGQDGAEENRGR